MISINTLDLKINSPQCANYEVLLLEIKHLLFFSNINDFMGLKTVDVWFVNIFPKQHDSRLFV